MAKGSILPAAWDVPREFRERLGAKVGRQRAMFEDGHLLLVLHAPPEPGEDERTGRFFWRRPDGTWTASALGSGVAALHKHVEEYADVVADYDQREERAATATEYFSVLGGLTPLLRAASNLHQVLQEARRLSPEDKDILNARDRAYEVERNAALLHDGARNALDFIVAKRAEEEARSARRAATAAHRLNLLAAFFFPIATLSALFGANLVHGLEQVWPPYPFFGIVALGLVLGVMITFFLTRSSQ